MSNNYLRASNPPRAYVNYSTYGNWGINCLYYDISNDTLVCHNYAYRFLINKNQTITLKGNQDSDYRVGLNYHYYNGNAFTISARFLYTMSTQINKIILFNNTNPTGILYTNTYPSGVNNLLITGCAVYGDTFYVVGIDTTTNPSVITVMDTSLSKVNPTNPFNTTTPTFKQTYASYTVGSNLNQGTRYTGMSTCDDMGNLYITTFGSGVYKYSFDSSYGSQPSLFINSTNTYSSILYNKIFDVFYIYKTTATTNSIDVYSKSGELLKLNYINNIPSPGVNTGSNCFQMACDPLGSLYYDIGSYTIYIVDKYVCFKKDTQILTFQGYKRIQDLKPGDLVKTLKHEYVPIYKIGFSEIDHPCNLEERTKDQLYKCSPNKYPEVFEDLVLTGCHSILVDTIESEEQMEKMIEINGRVCETDGKYRLPVCLDEKATVYDVPGNHTIYHLALENDDYYMNYGIYANGLLVESTSKRFMDTIKMTLVE